MASNSSAEVTSMDPIRPHIRRKRQLNLIKCERCRYDKVNCSPKRRVWPNKCARCIVKDLPCSEGSRVERKRNNTRKPKSTAIVSLNDELADSNLIEELEDQLYQRNVLSLYSENLAMALKRLKTLKEKTTEPFFNIREENNEIETKDEMQLKALFEESRLPLHKLTTNLLTMELSNAHLPTTLLRGILAQTFTTQSATINCPICYSSDQKRMLDIFEEAMDIPTDLLFRQNRLLGYFACDDHENHASCGRVVIDKELYVLMSAELSKIVPEILRMHKLDKAADLYALVGHYHPDILSNSLDLFRQEQMDCLKRTRLHCYLDDYVSRLDPNRRPSLDRFWELAVREFMNDKDILDRTPLHIMCQIGWQEGVEKLLNFGADPNLPTIYGSMPLHYAAANGFSDICELLLQHASNDMDSSIDCNGMTAYVYAQYKQHQGVIRVFTEYRSSRIQAEVLSNSILGFGSSDFIHDESLEPDLDLSTNTFLNPHMPDLQSSTYTHTSTGDLIVDSRLQATIDMSPFGLFHTSHSFVESV